MAAAEDASNLAKACDALARERRERMPGASDATQEACARVLELRDPSAIRDPLRYLWRIARNFARDQARKRQRDAALAEALALARTQADASPDPERILSGRQELRLVLAAIRDLPPRCREAFVQHRFHGLSYAAIARRMGISTSMVEKHVAHAMLKIKRAAQAGKGEGS